MVHHEPLDLGREAAQLTHQRLPPLRVAADHRVLVVGQRAGLLEDLVRDGELAHVVQQPADREAAKPPGRQAELLADLDGAQRDAAGV